MRRRSLRTVTTENPTTETTTRTTPAVVERFPFTRSSSVEFVIVIEPALPFRYVILSSTPVSPSKKASDTMNDGSRSRMTMIPMSAPIVAEAARPIAMATHHGEVVRRRAHVGHERAGDAGVVADGQVDLPEEQDPDLGEAEHDDVRRLGEQVDEVLVGEEQGVLQLEEDDEDGEPPDDRQHAGLAVLEPLPRLGEVRRERARRRAPRRPRRPQRRRPRPGGSSTAAAVSSLMPRPPASRS